MAKSDEEKLAEDVERLTKALEQEAATFEMTAREAKLYELSLRGATEAQLAAAKAAAKDIDGKEQQAKTQERVQKGLDGAARVTGAVAGTATAQMQKGYLSVADTMSAVSQTASLIPGPIGAAASAVTGLLGAAIGALNFRWEEMQKRVEGATSSVLSGSRSMSQALQDVRVSAMTEEFQRITNAMSRLEGGMVGRMAGAAGSNPVLQNMLEQGLDADISSALTRAEQARRATEQMFNNPRFQRVAAQTGAGRLQSQFTDLGAESDASANLARSQSAALAGGGIAEEVSELAQRERLWQQFYSSQRRAGETEQQTRQRISDMRQQDVVLNTQVLAVEMQIADITRSQEQARRANLDLQIEQANLAGRQQVQVQQAQLDILRQQRGTLIPIVDQSQQLVELERMRRAGASEMAITRRREQLAAEAAVAQERARVQFANQAIERNRRPLEQFRLEMERLDNARDELITRTGGDEHAGIQGTEDREQLIREQARLVQGLIAQAGPLDRLSQVFEQGTAAAASAIRRAEVEQRGADPLTQLPAAMRALEAQAVSQSDFQRRSALALEAMLELVQE